MFREKETFNRSRAAYCLYAQNAGSAEDVSGEGHFQHVESRLLPVRTRYRVSRGCFGRRRLSTDREQPIACTTKFRISRGCFGKRRISTYRDQIIASTYKMLDQQRIFGRRDIEQIGSKFLPVRKRCCMSRKCFGRRRLSTGLEQIIASTYKDQISRECFGRRRHSTHQKQITGITCKILDQQRMFWEKETFNRSRAAYCLYVQNAGSAEDVSGEGDFQHVEIRSMPVRTRCRISRGVW
jgi:hypothetical protein